MVPWRCWAKCSDSYSWVTATHASMFKFTLLLTVSFSFLSAITLKIASYNVENLFDMQHDGSEYPEYVPYQHNWNPKILTQKLTNISEVICEMDADIIGLQEIENLNALKRLQQSLKKYGCPYPYRAITHKPKSAIQVAMLSKIPPQHSRDIVVTRSWGIRNILELKFQIEGTSLYVFVNHWNSKRSPSSKRLRSALALNKRLLSLPRGSEYVLLGDFNLHYNETIMTQNMHTHRASEMGEGRHYNLWFEYPIYRRWSHNFYGKKQALDAILIPPSMMDAKGVDYVNHSFGVFKKSYLFHPKGYILRWQYRKGRHQGRGYSDHLPIFARFSSAPYHKEPCVVNPTTIHQLQQKQITLPVLLKKVKVLSRAKNKAILQQAKERMALYGIDQDLEEGETYDIRVFKRQLYQGAYEIVDFSIEKRYDTNKKRN